MEAKKSVRLMLTGDNYVLNTNKNPRGCYAAVAATLYQADARFGNLEFPLSDHTAMDVDRAAALRESGTPQTMRMGTESITALQYAKYDVVGLANNHHMDYGAEASRETTALLKRAGIGYCGAGENAHEASRAAFIDCNGLRIGFLSYTMVCLPGHAARADRYGMATVKIDTTYSAPPPFRLMEQPGTTMKTNTAADAASLKALCDAIADAKKQADVVVCSYHWGVSKEKFDGPLSRQKAAYQMQVGRASIEAGATLIVGHHPHALQGIERYKNGLICYSLGNFVTSTGGAFKLGFPDESTILDCTLTSGGLGEAYCIPVFQDGDGIPRIVDGDNAAAVYNVLQGDSKEFATKFSVKDGRLQIN